MSYGLSEEATADIREIYRYGAIEHAFDAAEAYHDGLHRSFERLALYPGLGPLRTSRGRNVRILPRGSHVILYRASAAGMVTILRVVHARSDWLRRLR